MSDEPDDKEGHVAADTTDWICEQCGRVERLTIDESLALGWHFCEGDICPQCHADNIKHHRTNQDTNNERST